MFFLKDKAQLERRVVEALKLRPTLKFDHFGRFRILGSKAGFYTVICKKSDNGYKTAECTRKGAENGLVCYYALSALSLYIGLARRQQTALKAKA